MVSVLLCASPCSLLAGSRPALRITAASPPHFLPLWQRGGLAVVLACFGLVYAAGLFGVAQGLQRVDPRMKTMFEFHPEEDNSILRYATRLTFSSRLVYWQAGWGVFDEYPFLGVGLGNAGYYFPHTLSGYAWTQYEVRELAYRSDALAQHQELLGAAAGRNRYHRVRLLYKLVLSTMEDARSLNVVAVPPASGWLSPVNWL
jgi:O-antigen ligase